MIVERNAAVADVVLEEQNNEDTLMEPYQMTNANNPPRAFHPDRSTRKSDVLSTTIEGGEGRVETGADSNRAVEGLKGRRSPV